MIIPTDIDSKLPKAVDVSNGGSLSVLVPGNTSSLPKRSPPAGAFARNKNPDDKQQLQLNPILRVDGFQNSSKYHMC